LAWILKCRLTEGRSTLPDAESQRQAGNAAAVRPGDKSAEAGIAKPAPPSPVITIEPQPPPVLPAAGQTDNTSSSQNRGQDQPPKEYANLDPNIRIPSPPKVIDGLQSGSLWLSSDQLFRMEFNSGKLNISYAVPRSGMIKEGVRPGTVLFSGTVSVDGTVQGQAFRFSARCNAAVPYQVSGSIDAARRTIKVYGNVNYVNQECQTVPSKALEVLEFQRRS
jgi:hypothetical protein